MAYKKPLVLYAGKIKEIASGDVIPVANGGTGQSGGAWTTWTPVFTNLTIGNGTASARYKQIEDKTYSIAVHITLGSTSTVSLNASFTIPFTLANSTPRCIGSGSIYDISATLPYDAKLLVKSSTEFYIGIAQASTTNTPNILVRGVNTTIPITFTTGDILYVEGIIEVI